MASKKPLVSVIVAMGKGRVIGRKNGLIWPIPDDLKRFKALTMGHPVIMGRKTFESIIAMRNKPLPGRINVVVTRDPTWIYTGAASESVVVARSLGEAVEKARALDAKEIFIIGGAQIYEQALFFADRLYLTLVASEEEGDAYFPEYENIFTKKLSEEPRESGGLHYRWLMLEK